MLNLSDKPTYEELEEEIIRLKLALMDAQNELTRSTISSNGRFINGAGSSWLQHKNSVQRKTLRILSSRVRCQRLTLALTNELGRIPTEAELKALYNQMRAENLDPIEATRAINTLL